MSQHTFSHLLHAYALKRNLTLTANQISKLEQHHVLMQQWNKTHNLTRVVSLEESVVVHYLDSLIGSSFLDVPNEVMDFGTGAGFPGIVMAVKHPDSHFYLVDSVRKKTSFLRYAVTQMQLKNVTVQEGRGETFLPRALVVSRAAVSEQHIPIAAKCVAPGGQLALWMANVNESLLDAQFTQMGLKLKALYPYSEERLGHRAVVVAQKPL